MVIAVEVGEPGGRKIFYVVTFSNLREEGPFNLGLAQISHQRNYGSV